MYGLYRNIQVLKKSYVYQGCIFFNEIHFLLFEHVLLFSLLKILNIKNIKYLYIYLKYFLFYLIFLHIENIFLNNCGISPLELFDE